MLGRDVDQLVRRRVAGADLAVAGATRPSRAGGLRISNGRACPVVSHERGPGVVLEEQAAAHDGDGAEAHEEPRDGGREPHV